MVDPPGAAAGGGDRTAVETCRIPTRANVHGVTRQVYFDKFFGGAVREGSKVRIMTPESFEHILNEPTSDRSGSLNHPSA